MSNINASDRNKSPKFNDYVYFGKMFKDACMLLGVLIIIFYSFVLYTLQFIYTEVSKKLLLSYWNINKSLS